MKKKLVVALVTAFALSLAACGAQTDAEPKNTKEEVTSEERLEKNERTEETEEVTNEETEESTDVEASEHSDKKEVGDSSETFSKEDGQENSQETGETSVEETEDSVEADVDLTGYWGNTETETVAEFIKPNDGSAVAEPTLGLYSAEFMKVSPYKLIDTDTMMLGEDEVEYSAVGDTLTIVIDGNSIELHRLTEDEYDELYSKVEEAMYNNLQY